MRDEFSKKTRDILAQRVNWKCSNPACQNPTSGPHTSPEKAVNVGVAAHIYAASALGPRYDRTMSSEERQSIDNGVWLCQICAKLIDNDIDNFPASELRAWKQQAEHLALDALQHPARIGHQHIPVPNISQKTYHEARGLLIKYGWQPILNHWSHIQSFGPFVGNAKEFWDRGYHELVNASPTGYAFCLFKYHDIYKNTLHVVTAGEEDTDAGCQAHIQSYWLEINETLANRR
jgi:hypothetical protein